MAGTLREELASLKIDGPDPDFSRNREGRKPRREAAAAGFCGSCRGCSG